MESYYSMVVNEISGDGRCCFLNEELGIRVIATPLQETLGGFFSGDKNVWRRRLIFDCQQML